MTMAHILRAFPIALTALGVIIHTCGIFDVLPQTTFELDLLMLCIDFIVLLSLLLRITLGYYLAIFLYIQQSIMQPYWAYQKYLMQTFSINPIEVFITPILVFLSLIILIKNRNMFIGNKLK